jgi:uncharacterized membrane protein YheB (UPF0754 family)
MKIFYLLFYLCIGALIGWLTNTIAIWMLFHPFEEKRIWCLKIPFTPGLIPARMEKLAREVSKAIRNHFLDGADIKNLMKEMDLGVLFTYEIKKRMQRSMVLKPLITILDNKYLQNSINKASERIIERLEAKAVGGKLEGFIHQRILNDFHPQKVEEVILKVSKKELKYITYFGGILGGIIGTLQVMIGF